MPQGSKFETVQEAAERLGLTVRAIQKQAAAGKIPGAEKHGRAWMIPKGSEISAPDAENSRETGEPVEESRRIPPEIFARVGLPLINSAYTPGKVKEHIEAMEDEDNRRIALAEYHLFSGRYEEATGIVEPYMDNHDPVLRFSATVIAMFANIGSGHIHLAHFAMNQMHNQLEKGLKDDVPLRYHAISIVVAIAASVRLHLPLPHVESAEKYIRYLFDGMKLYACYILAYRAYLKNDYLKCLHTAELPLCMMGKQYPIAEIYLHIAAAMALVNMKRVEEAYVHIDSAWKLAAPDGIIQPFAEHHGLLQGMIERYFKKNDPKVFDKIIALTATFRAGWRKVRDPAAEEDAAEHLSTAEFMVAMLYTRGWTVREIAEHLELSERTISNRISDIFSKLGVKNKKELGLLMLK